MFKLPSWTWKQQDFDYHSSDNYYQNILILEC